MSRRLLAVASVALAVLVGCGASPSDATQGDAGVAADAAPDAGPGAPGPGAPDASPGSDGGVGNTVTGWPLQFVGLDLATAYPGIEYYSRFAVRGGLYPYTFSLLQAPAGMQIQTRTGEIKWTPAQGAPKATVEVEVTDSAGQSLTHSYAIDVTTSGFYFVDAAHGSDSNPGTLQQPFQTLQGVQSKSLPQASALYVRAGTYDSTGLAMQTMPAVLMAYPGEAPVLDCKAQRTCIGINGNAKVPILVQGFEIENSAFKFFWLDGVKVSVTWRNNDMHHIVVTNANDAYENPSFIFTTDGYWSDKSASDVTGLENGTEYGYRNLIVQNNQFYDMQNYQGDIHITAFTWYDVSYSLAEDNVIHDIDAGGCFDDKDDGWFNTFRHNVCYGSHAYGMMLASQYTASHVEVDHNLVIGDANDQNLLQVGLQPGFIQDVYIHHNTFINGWIAFGGPIYDSSSQAFVVKNNVFANDGTVTGTAPQPFYNEDGSYDPSASGITPGQAYVSAILTDKKVTFDQNVYWHSDATQPVVTWSWNSHHLDAAGWQALGFDPTSSFTTKPALSTDGTYSLSSADPSYGVYGKDFAPGTWQ